MIVFSFINVQILEILKIIHIMVLSLYVVDALNMSLVPSQDR
jgi:hypothetical protein